jgi:hypothetical protein
MSRTALVWPLLAAFVALFVARTLIPASRPITNGFLACYAGAQILREGHPGYTLYDRDAFLVRTAQIANGRDRDVYLSNPPLLAVACLPLASLSPGAAREWWIWLSALCFAAAVGLITQQLAGALQPVTLLALTALSTLATPAREQFFLGQTYALLLLLHVLGWRAFIRGQNPIAGIALALAMMLKVSGWPIALLMLARRRWSALGWFVLVSIALAALSLPWVGIDAWRTLFRVAIPEVMRWPAATLTVYQDTTGFWQHWLRYDRQFNPDPIADFPRLAALLTLATTLVACLVLWVRRRPDYVSFAAAVALTELISPAAEQYHYTLLLLPLAVLWHEVWISRSRRALLAALVATVLIGWPINFKAPHPAWALIWSYPRLLGGWILFAALLVPQGTHTSLRKLSESRSSAS